MTICNALNVDNRPKTCLSACCYASGRAVFSVEIHGVGEDNVMSRVGRYYLKSKPNSAGACVLLDEESLECRLGDDRPFNCKNYSCSRMRSYQDHWQNVKHNREQRGLD
jgi:hypothetical protein